MSADFYAFGEILWDCLPSGRHPGGAPFNVAAHLVQLGASAALISAVGRDEAGDEILAAARVRGVGTGLVRRHPSLPTGTVEVTLETNGNARYDIVQPVAWDEIEAGPEALEAVKHARGLIYGSLSGRSAHNAGQLRTLLRGPGPVRFFDANLRPPFADPARILELAAPADVLKLNHEEAGQLSAWIETGDISGPPPTRPADISAACALLAEATGTPRICVTRGADGAALWDRGQFVTASSPRVTVRDTVGAGDAFMAGMVLGLTRGLDPRQVLENACRIGAFVASQAGATPALPAEAARFFSQ